MEFRKRLNDEQLEQVSGGFAGFKDDIEAKVIDIIAECLDIDRNRINRNSNLVADLGADGLDIIDIFKEIDNNFDVRFSESVISKIISVGDIVSQIELEITLSSR